MSWRLTFVTGHWSIFSMTTVMPTNASMATVQERAFISPAVHIIKPYWSSASAINGPSMCCTTGVPKLSAHNPCINGAPAVITDSAPLPISEYLHTTRVESWWLGSANQTNVYICCYVHRKITHWITEWSWTSRSCIIVSMDYMSEL